MERWGKLESSTFKLGAVVVAWRMELSELSENHSTTPSDKTLHDVPTSREEVMRAYSPAMLYQYFKCCQLSVFNTVVPVYRAWVTLMVPVSNRCFER